MTAPSTATSLPPCPFVAGPRIEDPRLFVGRKDELRFLRDRMTGPQPVSVNVTGERRIGKSSLLYHFYQTWTERVPDPSHYVVIFLSLQDARCHQEKTFYRTVAKTLLQQPKIGKDPELAPRFQDGNLDRGQFSRAIRACHRKSLLPVLCLDEFEALLSRPREFDDGFYDGLRSLLDANALMLIVASRESLMTLAQDHRLTSRFFNLGQTLTLERFRPEEVDDLVRLPASTVPGAPAALSLEEQQTAREWGDGHPFYLQLAALHICEARQQGKSLEWARKRYEQERRVRERPRPLNRALSWLLRAVRWLAWDLPRGLGSLGKRIGLTLDNLTSWFLGAVILAMVILALVGIVPWQDLMTVVKSLVGAN